MDWASDNLSSKQEQNVSSIDWNEQQKTNLNSAVNEDKLKKYYEKIKNKTPDVMVKRAQQRF